MNLVCEKSNTTEKETLEGLLRVPEMTSWTHTGQVIETEEGVHAHPLLDELTIVAEIGHTPEVQAEVEAEADLEVSQGAEVDLAASQDPVHLLVVELAEVGATLLVQDPLRDLVRLLPAAVATEAAQGLFQEADLVMHHALHHLVVALLPAKGVLPLQRLATRALLDVNDSQALVEVRIWMFRVTSSKRRAARRISYGERACHQSASPKCL